jgi:hypothetical protein
MIIQSGKPKMIQQNNSLKPRTPHNGDAAYLVSNKNRLLRKAVDDPNGFCPPKSSSLPAQPHARAKQIKGLIPR